jgi:alkanesulfonate monooxygenase SsuD/methylene tetrahydromethanopterin reductase-like flavin-dependent oxidoreductase (luciferase family)
MQRMTDPANIPAWTEYQLVGSPETVARKVEQYAAAGFNHIALHTSTPAVPASLRREWLTRFATEVAPKFSNAFAAAGM